MPAKRGTAAAKLPIDEKCLHGTLGPPLHDRPRLPSSAAPRGATPLKCIFRTDAPSLSLPVYLGPQILWARALPRSKVDGVVPRTQHVNLRTVGQHEKTELAVTRSPGSGALRMGRGLPYSCRAESLRLRPCPVASSIALTNLVRRGSCSPEN